MDEQPKTYDPTAKGPYQRTGLNEGWWVLGIFGIILVIAGGFWQSSRGIKTEGQYSVCSKDFCAQGDIYQFDQASGCALLANKVDSSTAQVTAKFCGTEWKVTK